MTRTWEVPRAWPGETVAVLASGPSMSKALCDQLRGRCRTIAVSNVGIDSVDSTTGQIIAAPAPWADVLFASDAKWWREYRARAMAFAGLKITSQNGLNWDELHCLAFSPRAPFDERPTHIVSGGNSGYQAVHIAAHFGATRILLFGFDMREAAPPGGGQPRRHYFGNHPPPCNSKGRFDRWIRNFVSLATYLDTRRVKLINCTPGSALRIARSTLEAEFPPLPVFAPPVIHHTDPPLVTC